MTGLVSSEILRISLNAPDPLDEMLRKLTTVFLKVPKKQAFLPTNVNFVMDIARARLAIYGFLAFCLVSWWHSLRCVHWDLYFHSFKWEEIHFTKATLNLPHLRAVESLGCTIDCHLIVKILFSCCSCALLSDKILHNTIPEQRMKHIPKQ